MRGGGSGGSLWVDGELLLRVGPRAGDPGGSQILRVRRPFAVVGRVPGTDVRLGDPAVSARHVYLHLDRRGVFGVDLLSRTGSRFHDESANSAWIQPGQHFEVAGHSIKLLEARVDGQILEPSPCNDDPLGDEPKETLARVVLEPRRSGGRPWIIGSEIVFLGRSAACGVRVEAASASRAHCVLIRTGDAAFLVDLIGRLTWVNRRPVRGAARLRDGDLLTIGGADYAIRIDPVDPAGPASALAPLARDLDPKQAEAALATLVPQLLGRYQAPGELESALGGHEGPQALLSWMLGLFQAGQGEMMRRQNDFQVGVIEALRQIQDDNAALLREHLKRIAGVQRELIALRAQVEQLAKAPAPDPTPGPPPPRRPPGPGKRPAPDASSPRRPAPAKAPVVPPPLRLPPPPEMAPTGESATWLLQRIGQLEEQNRSTWRDLLARLGTSPRKSE